MHQQTWDLIRRSRLSIEHLDALFQLYTFTAYIPCDAKRRTTCKLSDSGISSVLFLNNRFHIYARFPVCSRECGVLRPDN